MSSTIPEPIVHSARVGKFHVTWTFDGVEHTCEWDPRMPRDRKEIPMRRYREVRAEFLAKVHKSLDLKSGKTAVLELG